MKRCNTDGKKGKEVMEKKSQSWRRRIEGRIEREREGTKRERENQADRFARDRKSN